MKNTIFVSFCLVLFSMLMGAHMLFREGLNPTGRLEARIERLSKERQAAEFRELLAAHELAEFQQYVATLLPDAMKSRPEDERFQLRQLASVVGDKGAALEIERASGIFEKAKIAFREKRFEESNRLFQSLIKNHPASVHVGEAYFLLAEGHYQMKEYDSAVTGIERMIELFPENELTGFALLRLGHIFELQERLEDAGEIYRAVLSNFKQPALVKQASSSLKAVAL